ncbi:MAG: WYL domain-containing protein [Thermodesulfovibrionales bacterium]|nr:WYL domain-containing protein [Thermodesulfovibrionales bacterium]
MTEQLRCKRLFEIYNMLLENGRISKDKLCSYFNISSRTAERDIAFLCSIPGLSISGKRDPHDGKWYYCLPDEYRHQRNFIKNNQEILILLLSLSLCHFSSAAEGDLKERFSSALRSAFPLKFTEELFYYHDEAPHLNPLRLDTLLLLFEAYRNKNILSLKTRDGRRLNFRLFKIIHYVDEFYICGQIKRENEIVILSLHEIEEIKILKKTYSIPEDFSIEKYLESAFGIIPGRKEEIHLQFQKEIADYIKQRLWHTSQKIEEKEDGSVILKMNVAINEELIKWILSHGSRIKVLKPDRLRDLIRSEIEKTLGGYKNDMI